MKDSIQSTDYEHEGHTITINWFYDQDMGPPWEEHDGHGIVSEWKHSHHKAPGERILCSDRGSHRFYDWQGTMMKARAEGWGLHDDDKAAMERGMGRAMTKGEIIAEAVRRDYEYLRRWCNDQWHWVGYMIEVTDPDGYAVYFTSDLVDSLWGIDSDSMKDYEAEAIEAAKAAITAEIAASHDAACRDIETAA